MAGEDIAKIARDLVSEHPDYPAQSLAKMLIKRTNGALTLNAANLRIRRILGVHGERNRKRTAPDLFRERRESGREYRAPPSIARPWTPYEFDVVGKVGILSDIHVPYHSDVALRAAVEYLADAQIDGLLLNGDVCDFYAISRYTKDPRQRDFSGELEACRDFLSWIAEMFAGKRIVMKAGNHEERWQHFIWQHAPELSKEKRMSLQAWLDLDKHGIDLVEDQRPVMLGKLPVIHGHEEGKGIAAPVNPARGSFLRLNHTVIKGHHHRTSSHSEPDMFGREIVTWSTGCLCDLRPEYARFNKWNHGFAVVTVHDDETFDVENLRITGEGKVRSS
jgi:predicted phosphodiesterase